MYEEPTDDQRAALVAEAAALLAMFAPGADHTVQVTADAPVARGRSMSARPAT